MVTYLDPFALVQVIDPTKTKGQFEDTSEVEKFELTDAAYGERKGTV